MTNRLARFLGLALLAALPFALYSNSYHHAFQLDDAYTVVSNPHVRSLRAIPSYFADPSTYTSVREQAEYRPILQTTFALNYWLGGYDMWWWHFTQILLHALVTLGIYALCRRIAVMTGAVKPDAVALFAAAVFAVHPTASGVVNYVNARSSLLTATFLLPALLAYMTPASDEGYARPQWRTALLFALALWTKVEAVGALGAFWAFDLWQRGIENPDASVVRAVRASFDRRTLRRLAPALAITVVYFVVRATLMAPFPLGDARHAADVGPYQYFVTQLTAWWYYLLNWLAPVRLVADNLAYPVYRSWREPQVLLAVGGWSIVAALLIALWKRAPYVVFLAIATLALLGPTSSIAPLAEMVNEHRPYLPMGMLSLAAIVPASQGVLRWKGEHRTGLLAGVLAGVALMLVAFCGLTYRRNRVFATGVSYWADVLEKAPSSRAHLNYGVALMANNDMPAAMQQLRRSLELAPRWYFTHINLGVAYRHLGLIDSARAHFDSGVAEDQYSGLALTWRGEFHLSQREYADARDDFLRSLPLALHRYRNLKGLATAYAGLGDAGRAQERVTQMQTIDSASAAADATAIRGLLAQAGASGGFGANTVVLASSEAAQQATMVRGLELMRRGDVRGAEAEFRRVIAMNPTHYGAHFQLATTLDRMSRRREARTIWESVLRMAESYQDRATAQTARDRLRASP